MKYWNSNPFNIRQESLSIKDGALDFAGRHREVSEAFLVGDSPSLWLGRIISSRRLRLFFILFLLFFTILFTRLVYLQFIKSGDYVSLAEGNRLRLEFIQPVRGIIFDRFSVPLVENIATFSLFFNPNDFKAQPAQREEIRKILSGLAFDEREADEILASESYLWQPVKENLEYETAIKLMLQTVELSSLRIEVDPQRKYPDDSALAHLLGYTSRITPEEKDEYLGLGYQLTEKVGRVGLEEFYQTELRGIPGKKQSEVDSLGRETNVIASEPAMAGDNIFLSLDIGLQRQIYKTLAARVPAKAGAVIALDPNNGKIRALVSWPTYDNNQFSLGLSQDYYQKLLDNPLKPFINRALSGEYPSGSTVKLIMAVAGLEEGLITKATSILSLGGVWYDKWFFPDWKAGGHGRTNLIKALAESVNTYFYYLALEEFEGHRGLGLDKILHYYRKFGLGHVLGIDLAGEKSGFLPSQQWKEEVKDEPWYPGDTLHLAIGQGDLLVTPLQVAVYTSVIANGGTLYRPSLLEKIANPETGEIKTVQPEIIREKLATEKSIGIVAEGMREAVLSGSARGIDLAGIRVAGKTGTAEVGGNKSPHAWFTGYLPYENPGLVLTVLVENGGEGSETAVPIARDIAGWYAENRF